VAPAGICLSVVVPAHDERENLGPLVEEVCAALSGLDRPWELLLVDDGSTDGTGDLMRELAAANPFLRYLRLDARHGQTAAWDAGFRHARGEIVATMDADLQNDPADIPRMLPHLEGADVVSGMRLERRDTLWRRIQSRLANRLRNRLTGDWVTDVGCSLRLVRREYLERVKLYDGLHRYLPTLLKWEGARVVEVEVSHRPRTAGRTKYGFWGRFRRGARDLFAVRWMRDRHLAWRVVEEGGAGAEEGRARGEGASQGGPSAEAGGAGGDRS
jgi:glycosyltransferase involved in cell wall biosynthesis